MFRWRPLAVCIALATGLVVAAMQLSSSPSPLPPAPPLVLGLSAETREKLCRITVEDFGEENLWPYALIDRLNELTGAQASAGRLALGSAAQPAAGRHEASSVEFAWAGHWSYWGEFPPHDEVKRHGPGPWYQAQQDGAKQPEKVASPAPEALQRVPLDVLLEHLAKFTRHEIYERDGKVLLVPKERIMGELKMKKVGLFYPLAGELRQAPGGVEAKLREEGLLVRNGSYARLDWTGRNLLIFDVPSNLDEVAWKSPPQCCMGVSYSPTLWDRVVDTAYSLPNELASELQQGLQQLFGP